MEDKLADIIDMKKNSHLQNAQAENHPALAQVNDMLNQYVTPKYQYVLPGKENIERKMYNPLINAAKKLLPNYKGDIGQRVNELLGKYSSGVLAPYNSKLKELDEKQGSWAYRSIANLVEYGVGLGKIGLALGTIAGLVNPGLTAVYALGLGGLVTDYIGAKLKGKSYSFGESLLRQGAYFAAPAVPNWPVEAVGAAGLWDTISKYRKKDQVTEEKEKIGGYAARELAGKVLTGLVNDYQRQQKSYLNPAA